MNELDAVAALTWITERFQYFVIVILIVISSTVYTILTPDPYNYPIWKRGIFLAYAVILMGLIVGGITKYYELELITSSIISVMLGVGAPKLGTWLLRIWQKSDTPEQLLSEAGRIGKAFNAAKDNWTKSSTDEKQPPEQEQHD
jgi:hypothetical protein